MKKVQLAWKVYFSHLLGFLLSLSFVLLLIILILIHSLLSVLDTGNIIGKVYQSTVFLAAARVELGEGMDKVADGQRASIKLFLPSLGQYFFNSYFNLNN